MACAIAVLVALAGAAVRVLPWLLEPAVSAKVALPFVRSLAALAVEAAIFVGWPVGWALAAAGFVERGEHKVLQTLGERPGRTVARLLPQGAVFAAALAAVSFWGGRDAGEPGRVVSELLAEGRAACSSSIEPRAYVIPFAGAAWLCAPGAPPHIAGRGPGALGRLAFSAADAEVAGDLRRIELEDARIVFAKADVHVGRATLKGLTPWAHASNLPPTARALLLAVCAAAAAASSVYAALRRWIRRRFGAIAVGASGPLAALGLLRMLERTDVRPGWAVLALPVALGASLGCAWLLVMVRRARLPRSAAAAST